MKLSIPRLLLHAEGLFVLAGACFLYGRLGDSWIAFAALFLVPDLSMLGYIAGPKAGAWCYNAVHTYLGPACLAALSYLSGGTGLTFFAVIWVAHIGFDRLLGYGLKYPGSFKDTHIQRI